MRGNLLVYLKYINFNMPHSNLLTTNVLSGDVEVFVTTRSLVYITTHLRLSTLFYTSQLCDIFSYELPMSWVSSNRFVMGSFDSIIVYNFHLLSKGVRLCIYAQGSSNNTPDSLVNIFPSANWLEREASELSGIHFAGKSDVRNLLLQYGDTNSPFKKSFPSIGLKEFFYSPLVDSLVQKNITLSL